MIAGVAVVAFVGLYVLWPVIGDSRVYFKVWVWVWKRRKIKTGWRW